MSAAATPRAVPPVVVEVLFLRHDPASGLAWRRVATDLPARTHPDRVVGHLGRSGGQPSAAALAHSTSWRCEEGGQVVLTYLAHPDPDPAAPAVTLTAPEVLARGAASDRPAPEHVSVAQVAAHAVRHLVFLRRTDPVVAAYLAGLPGLGAALAALPYSLAGQAGDA
ncbi:hypothetical protein [Streptomyces sp. NPDC088923]|uniref:hypothetical protein n=1 Tax=Streptomyces sp. NPDC088923 TaxID=3365913 RepID=UPI0038177D14